MISTHITESYNGLISQIRRIFTIGICFHFVLINMMSNINMGILDDRVLCILTYKIKITQEWLKLVFTATLFSSCVMQTWYSSELHIFTTCHKAPTPSYPHHRTRNQLIMNREKWNRVVGYMVQNAKEANGTKSC